MELSKSQAAKYLNISTRALERLTQQGKLSVKYVRGSRGKQARYQQSDLDELKKELETPIHKPKVESPSTSSTDLVPLSTEILSLADQLNNLAVPLSTYLEQIAVAISNLPQSTQGTSVPIENKLLLTLREVQALTGLSRGILKQAITTKKLKAQIMGKAWRIKRTDLEDYIKTL